MFSFQKSLSLCKNVFSPIHVLSRIFLILSEWLLFMEWTTAYETGCHNGYCFVASNPKSEILTQSDAQNWCTANGTKLVDIRDGNIQDAISRFLKTVDSGYRYDSNTGIFTSGKRHLMNWSRINGDGIDSLSVSDSEDSNKAYAFLQYSTSSVSIKAALHTDWKNGYICENDSTCSQVTGLWIGSNCYKHYIRDKWIRWYDARQCCLDSGGELTSLSSIQDSQGLRALNSTWPRTYDSFWIGIRREQWQWDSSGSDVQYSNWAFDHPKLYPDNPRDCLCLFPPEWKWCDELRPFLCFSVELSSPTSTTSSTRTSIPTTTTPATTVLSMKSHTTYHRSNPDYAITSTEIHSFPPIERDAAEKNVDRNLDVKAAIGIGVGIVIIIVAIVIIVIVIIWKRRPQSDRLKEKNKAPKCLQSPDIISQQTDQGAGNTEQNPYCIVIKNNQTADSTSEADNNTEVLHTVYADLEFATTSTEDNKKIATDKNKGGFRSVSYSEEKNVKSSNIDEQEYANITKA